MSKTIIVIDDDESFLKVALRVLNGAGYTTVPISDSSAALKSVQTHDADLVVTDIFMPGTDGMELISEIRRIKPKQKIIAISGGGALPAGESLRMAEMLGAGMTLRKPFSGDELLGLVSLALAGPDNHDSFENHDMPETGQR